MVVIHLKYRFQPINGRLCSLGGMESLKWLLSLMNVTVIANLWWWRLLI